MTFEPGAPWCRHPSLLVRPVLVDPFDNLDSTYFAFFIKQVLSKFVKVGAAMYAADVSNVPGSGRERVLLVLKTKGPQTAALIAKSLGVTTMAIRQHLAVLEGEKLVDFTDEKRTVGRPARLWRLTSNAYDRFPDCHAELAVGMLQAVQSAFGEQGLDRLTEERTRQQVQTYRARMPDPEVPLEDRLSSLARIRREEGYMAEWKRRDGALELVENHCSIAKAARLCPNLCGGELSLFRTVLGENVSVERVEHILSGDRCCSYRITERPNGPNEPASDKIP